MNNEYDIIDLEPYESGKKQMMFRCSYEKCTENIDITKSFIIMEKQNNIRKTVKGYNPACDKLYIFTRYCAKHEGNTDTKSDLSKCIGMDKQ